MARAGWRAGAAPRRELSPGSCHSTARQALRTCLSRFYHEGKSMVSRFSDRQPLQAIVSRGTHLSRVPAAQFWLGAW